MMRLRKELVTTKQQELCNVNDEIINLLAKENMRLLEEKNDLQKLYNLLHMKNTMLRTVLENQVQHIVKWRRLVRNAVENKKQF